MYNEQFYYLSDKGSCVILPVVISSYYKAWPIYSCNILQLYGAVYGSQALVEEVATTIWQGMEIVPLGQPQSICPIGESVPQDHPPWAKNKFLLLWTWSHHVVYDPLTKPVQNTCLGAGERSSPWHYDGGYQLADSSFWPYDENVSRWFEHYL